MKKYIVELTVAERRQLQDLVAKGKVAGYKIRHAQMLLKADQGEQRPGWQDGQIAEAFGSHVSTVERLRKRLMEEGLEAALERRRRHNYPRKLDGEGEAHLIALACSQAPQGRSRWSLRLLADRLVQLGVVESVSHMTVSRMLKKTNSSPG